MFADCRRAFELAVRDGQSQKLCVTRNSAVHFRQRMYQFRQLEAKALEDVYRMRPETFEMIGTTPFDKTICRIEPVDVEVMGKKYEWAVNVYREEETPLLNYKGEVEPEYQAPAKDEPELLG
jgi:hypothetical protein